MTQLLELLKQHNIDIVPDFSGRYIRNASQWFKGSIVTVGDKSVRCATFGDWRVSHIGQSWQSDSDSLSESELKELKVTIKVKEKLAREELQKLHLARSLELTDQYSALADTPLTGVPHDYLAMKQCNRTADTKIDRNLLVIPLRDTHGKLWNLQTIDTSATKRFQYDARIQGLFHTLHGNLKTATKVYLCEGYATGCSISQALPEETVLCAFNAWNLVPVVIELRKCTKATIIVCADNDLETVVQGRPHNTGLLAAQAAAATIENSALRVPLRPDQPQLSVDWNDLAQSHGIALVRRQLLIHELTVTTDTDENPEILVGKMRGKQILPPTQHQVSEALLNYFGDSVVKKDKLLFRYRINHWVEMGPDECDLIKQRIAIMCSKQLGSRDLDAYFNYWRAHVTVVPREINLFQPNPYIANFLNGTIHLVKEEKCYRVVRKDHNKLDFCVNVLPFIIPEDLNSESVPSTTQFDEMLKTLFSNDSDKGDKRRLILQMMGACLIPAFPFIGVFVGHSGSGKTSLIQLILKLVSKENTCSVQMCDMHGFNMETMARKLVNYDTDIDTTRPMNDTMVKKLIDRTPFRIRRKNKTDEDGFLPAVHLFAANELPVTRDGASKAYARRLTIIKTNSARFLTTDLSFIERLWETEKDGIIRLALAGLLDLAASNGTYVGLESSRELVVEMQERDDIIKQYFDSVNSGEVQCDSGTVVIDNSRRILTGKLYENFNDWQIESIPNRALHMGRNRFRAKVNGIFRIQKSCGIEYYEGIGHLIKPNGNV
jgi:putative DNA primase/helicase